jgi:hypothetical protein
MDERDIELQMLEERKQNVRLSTIEATIKNMNKRLYHLEQEVGNHRRHLTDQELEEKHE